MILMIYEIYNIQYVHDKIVARLRSAGDASMKFIQSACYKNSSNRCAGISRQQVSPRWLGPISARSRDECDHVTKTFFVTPRAQRLDEFYVTC